jgi:hypothetical protein
MMTAIALVLLLLFLVCAFGWIGHRKASRQLFDRLNAARAEDQQRLFHLEYAVDRYADGIREHRNVRGDDRCWRDDEALYRLLPEGYTPPEIDTAVELERCKQFIASRQNPATVYVSPEREIERLRPIAAAAKYIHDRFVKDEADGYRSRDRQFAIEILGKALSS